MSHGAAGWYHAVVYGALAVCFFGMLWRWRQWYATAPDGAPARRSLRLVGGAALLFVALWLTCGRVSMGIDVLRWAVPPVALAGMGLLAAGVGRGA